MLQADGELGAVRQRDHLLDEFVERHPGIVTPTMSSGARTGRNRVETIRVELAAAAAETARVVAGVRDEQLDDPTPCVGTPVAGLLDHLAVLTTAFRLAA